MTSSQEHSEENTHTSHSSSSTTSTGQGAGAGARRNSHKHTMNGEALTGHHFIAEGEGYPTRGKTSPKTSRPAEGGDPTLLASGDESMTTPLTFTGRTRLEKIHGHRSTVPTMDVKECFPAEQARAKSAAGTAADGDQRTRSRSKSNPLECVLVVDDTSTVRNLLKRAVSRMGLEVDTACNGEVRCEDRSLRCYCLFGALPHYKALLFQHPGFVRSAQECLASSRRHDGARSNPDT